jgi:hemerythrin-like domain-containing protein
MQLLDELREEHGLIDRVLGALRTCAAGLGSGRATAEDAFALLQFLELYAGQWHHSREEEVLFPALKAEVMVPGDRGPVAVLLEDHRVLERSLAEMRIALAAADHVVFERLAIDYSRALWAHIDVENSVLLPESEIQLRRAHAAPLPVREMPAAVREIAARAEKLLALYPEEYASDVVRGDGCVICPAYLETCRGIEREWWNQWAWEEFDEHIAAS